MNARLRLTPLLVSVALVAGCSSFGRLSTLPGSSSSEDPWEISAESYPTQRLYRVKYDGPEGRLGFKLTLYLEGEARFRMQAADSLGRKIWDLSVDESDRALWLDHRRKRYCQARGASRLALVPLAHLPLAALPKLLLGRMPATPAADLRRTKDVVSYLDARGQLWNGALADGRLQWWTLVEAGEAVTWWRRDGDAGIFGDLRGKVTLRWREVIREPLARMPARLEIPPRYGEGACGGRSPL
ncbi:MAG: hypothetical protein GY856_15790 [bacterium]|nr:hypothetical protein [bacterium]